MLGRALGFSDPEVIRLIRENFIPVVGDDWYQRRRKDAVGTFFRSVVDQTWKAGNWEPGGGNDRQGIYCFTPSGRMLTEMKNVGSQPEEIKRVLNGAMAGWKGLPEADRRPGAVAVPDVALDPGFHRPVPAGALVLRQYQRGLQRDSTGTLSAHLFKFQKAPVWAQRDRAWVLPEEWKALVPAAPAAGMAVDVPLPLRHRLIRFHFVESLVGEPGMWTRPQIRSAEFTLTVDTVTPARLRMTLKGGVKMSTEDAVTGLEGTLEGVLTYDRAKGVFDRFDVVLIADCWGALNPHNGVSRPGRNPVGFAFELGTGEDVDRVPPQGARLLEDYLKP